MKAKCGGMLKASRSVLKLVISIHRIGKNMARPTAHEAMARTVWARWRRDLAALMVGCSTRSQRFADQPDQEERHDVGQNDSDQAAGRSGAHVELEERLRVDQEGDVGRGISRS